MSEPINKEAQAIIDRIEKAAQHYGEVFDLDKVTDAMKRHYAALGVPMPKVVYVENWEEGFKSARDAARDAARGAAWDAARGAAWDAARGAAIVNTGLKDSATLKFLEIELPILEALEAGLGLFFPMKECLIVTPVPKFRMNAQNLLHSHQLKAVEFKDGTGLYYLNGVKFPEDLWKQVTSGEMPFKDILAIIDTDQRTQAMRFGNVRDFIKHAKGEKLDEFQKMRLDGTKVRYQLYKFPKGDIFTEDAYYMIYDDIVPGSDKWYMSGVPESKSVAEAMAWKFSDEQNTLTKEDWIALTPGLDMN